MQVLLKCILKQNRWGYESRTGITVSPEKQSSEGSSQRLHIMKKTESTTSSAVLQKSKVKQNVTKPKAESSQSITRVADEDRELQKGCIDIE